MGDTHAALLLLVEALLLTLIRKNISRRDEIEALRWLVHRTELPKNEIEALLVTMIRKKLLSRDEMIGAVEDAVQALLIEGQPAQAEVLQGVRRRIIKAV
jgi:hypothetical protein